jgi:hypothetical protein
MSLGLSSSAPVSFAPSSSLEDNPQLFLTPSSLAEHKSTANLPFPTALIGSFFSFSSPLIVCYCWLRKLPEVRCPNASLPFTLAD